jgi:hypothetical protein
MSFFRRKITRPDAAKAAAARPLYLGKIRADHYAEALRDPDVRATLARAVTNKTTRST